MAKKPTPKPAAPRNLGGRPTSAIPQKSRRTYLTRFPPLVFDGIERRAHREGASLNDIIAEACSEYGDFPDGRPAVTRTPVSGASKVRASKPVPAKPAKKPVVKKGAKPAKAKRTEPEEAI